MEIKPGDKVKVQGSKGVYTVIEQDGSGHRLEDPHGNEVWVPTRRITAVPPPTKNKVARKSAPHANATNNIVTLDAFVEHLQQNCFIAGSGPAKERPRFECRYAQETGHVLNGQGRHIYWTENGRARTFSLKVRFPVPIDAFIMPPSAIADKTGRGFYEICSNEFVFELLRQGFDLGQNGKLAA